MRTSRLVTFFLLTVAAAALSISVSAQERVEVRWFVGLGAGTDSAQIEVQEQVVDEFNASQDEIELVLEIVDNDSAYGILNTQIAAGNAPDIIGPVGIRGRAAVADLLLDLTPLIEATNYDLSDFEPELVEFYNVEGQGQIGIPFAIFPFFLLYNQDLFDEAGLPYPPAEYGQPYTTFEGEEVTWDMDALRDVAMLLTVDANGNDPTMEGFNPDEIVQFGYGTQYTDIRGRLTQFGAASFVDADGNAQVPENWAEGLEWYQQAMWEDYFYPNGVYGGSDILAGGNWFDSGNIGMIGIHLWYMTCCLFGLDEAGANYDLAAFPSYDGVTTAKLHGDTFSILNTTENPEEAFTVLSYLVGDAADTLTQTYGGLPARLSLQDGYFDAISVNAPISGRDLNWDVVLAGQQFGDNPSHESNLPNIAEAEDVYNTWTSSFDNNPDFDLETEIPNLIAALQEVFDAARE